MTGTPNRRERQRAATVEEIHATARQLLISEGPGGVSLRAIGRAMGMTAPALYRYYASLDDLREGMSAGFIDECREFIEAAVELVPAAQPDERIYAACRAFRQWALGHPAEFEMMFGSPIAQAHDGNSVTHQAGERFMAMFLGLYVALFIHGDVRVRSDADVPADLREQFAEFLAKTDAPLSLGAVHTFASCWTRLYGMVALETFGHLHPFITGSGDALFESELVAFARELGLDR